MKTDGLEVGQEVYLRRSLKDHRIIQGRIVSFCFPAFKNLDEYNKVIIETENWLGLKRLRMVELGEVAVKADEQEVKP